MNNADIATVSTESTPPRGLETTTCSSSPRQLCGKRVFHLLAALVLCPLLVVVADAADNAVDPSESRATNEQSVARFVFGAVADPLQVEETVALAKLKARRKPGEALILGGMTRRVLRTLQQAYPLALERVREVDSCRELFAQLGAEGVGTLGATVYRPAGSQRELEICSSTTALAFTGIGSSQTRLCLGFGSQSRETAAMILIHEALHAAGMTEQPYDPEALSSFQINRMVLRACDL
jgi:hypothetical protein